MVSGNIYDEPQSIVTTVVSEHKTVLRISLQRFEGFRRLLFTRL